jgi:hypothetical protein
VVKVQDLQVVAVTSDGSAVVVADDAGRQYRLRIDDRLKAAVRGERLHEGQLEIALTSQLSPRDIQARVRAGATVDEVAEVAGVSTERVLRYAAPVLDERRHMAQRAQRAFVRTEGLTEVGVLGEVVGGALRVRGAADSLRWDAWRREDGRWLVVSRWAEAGTERAALWLLDPAGRSVGAHDDDARSLAGLPCQTTPAPTRLAVVRDEEKAGSGHGAAAGVAVRTPESEDDTPTGPIPAVAAAAAAPTPSPARPARPRPRTRADEDERLWLTDIADNVVVEETARVSGEGAPSRRARPAVPSWDEIMFGRRG